MSCCDYRTRFHGSTNIVWILLQCTASTNGCDTIMICTSFIKHLKGKERTEKEGKSC